MSSGCSLVAFLTVQRKIETFDFIARRDTKPDRFVDEKKQDESSDDGDDPCNRDSSKLVQQLMPVTFDQSGRQNISSGVFEHWVDGAAGKNARENCPEGSACAMHSKCI